MAQGRGTVDAGYWGAQKLRFRNHAWRQHDPRLLMEAALQGIELYVWYVGLQPELHIERVRARLRRGGHDIAAEHTAGATNIAA